MVVWPISFLRVAGRRPLSAATSVHRRLQPAESREGRVGEGGGGRPRQGS